LNLTTRPLPDHEFGSWEKSAKRYDPVESPESLEQGFRSANQYRSTERIYQDRYVSDHHDAMRSPMTIAGTFVFARGMTGMIEQSATLTSSSP
jgi:hypothetical protein